MRVEERRREAPFSLVATVLVLATVASLAALYVLPSPYATLLPDTIRDLSASLRLARGQAIPMIGPPINFGPHLGPAWIWLQSVPLLFVPSFAAVAVFVAIVASTKFWFLFEIGRAWDGLALGACLALAAAFPSIAIFQWHAFFHPNLVEAGICAALALAVLAVRRHSMPWWYGACAMLGLAVQLHPTAVFYLPLLLVALMALQRSASRRLFDGGIALILIAAWFLPLLFATGTSHAQEMSAGVARVHEGLHVARIADAATVMRTAYITVPIAIGDTYAPLLGVPRWTWLVLLLTGAAGFIAGAGLLVLGRDRRKRLVFAGLIAYLAIGWMIAAAVRAYTSYYLCYFLLPLSAIVAGLALQEAFTSQRRTLRLLAAASACATLLCAAIASLGAVALARGAFIDSRLPALGDLKHPGSQHVRARLLGARQRDGLARFACKRGGRAWIHGDWAYALAASMNLDFDLHCPGRMDASLMGNGAPGWTVLTLHEGVRVEDSAMADDGVAVLPVLAAYGAAGGKPIERDWYQFDALRDRQPMSHLSTRFTTHANEGLMIVRLKPFASRWENFSVRRNGADWQPAGVTFDSFVYTSNRESEWTVAVDTDAPQWVDLHVFSLRDARR